MTASCLATILGLAILLQQPIVRSDVRIVPALEAFERGQWTDGDVPALEPETLIDILKGLKDAGPAWVLADGPSQERRRRLAVATYVLHVLETQDDAYLWQGGGSPFRYRKALPAADLLEWACAFLRGAPPLVAERWWHLDALALLERHDAEQAMDLQLQHAHGRFPSEDRWVLGRAIAQDLHTWPEPRDERPFQLTPAATAAIIARYQEAIERPSVRDEALVRLGYFELRRQRAGAALACFDQAGTSKDGYVRYWRNLFRGQALELLNRRDDAIGSFREALVDAPFAQSAVFSLAASLTAAGQDEEAARLVQRATTIQPVARDPWIDFTSPDWRFRGHAMEQLRKAIAP